MCVRPSLCINTTCALVLSYTLRLDSAELVVRWTLWHIALQRIPGSSGRVPVDMDETAWTRVCAEHPSCMTPPRQRLFHDHFCSMHSFACQLRDAQWNTKHCARCHCVDHRSYADTAKCLCDMQPGHTVVENFGGSMRSRQRRVRSDLVDGSLAIRAIARIVTTVLLGRCVLPDGTACVVSEWSTSCAIPSSSTHEPFSAILCNESSRQRVHYCWNAVRTTPTEH